MKPRTKPSTVGIDLGDRKHSVCVLNHKGGILREETIANTRESLRALSRRQPGSLMVMEVGMHSPWISRFLTEPGHLHRMNGTLHLVFCGDHNHFDGSILGFFRRLLEIAPHSYGKLHVRDDEDSHGFNDSMRQWTFARGQVIESIIPSMSPCIPTLEAENP